MPTFIKDLDYSIHAIKSVTHQLKVIEEPDIPNNRSKLTVSIVRNNSSNISEGGREYLTLKVNGESVFDNVSNTSAPPAYGSDEVFKQTHYVSHDASGGGSFTVSASYKCDNIEGYGWFSDVAYYTAASAEITKSVTAIDQSSPSVENISISSDRYGLNALVSFTAKHSAYNLTSIQFILSGLTLNQSYYRLGKETQADSSKKEEAGSGTYNLILTKTENLTNSVAISFDLNDWKDGKYPLDSGGNYPYEIVVTALNGKQAKVSGTLKVPQKVTGVTCESQLEIPLGQSAELEYQVEPYNAEDLTVTFSSSDPTVATVDKHSGLITPVNDGMCQITVTTLDGGSPDAVSGFSASCTLSVINTDVFPKLSEIRYLTVREITRLSFACKFLHEKLTEKGIAVSELSEVICEGKSHPVKEIKSLLETIESNCLLLKSVSSSVYPTESLSEQQNIIAQNIGINWHSAINEWIHFLNELNSQIEKEA